MFGIKKKREIAILVNPLAAENRENPGLAARRLENALRKLHPAIYIVSALDEIYSIAEEFIVTQFKYLLLSGGNGTFHHVISRFKTIYRDQPLPQILLLKAGHINTIAESINLRGNGIEIATRFATIIKSGKSPIALRKNLIKIEDRYCAIFGCGIITTFMDLYYQMGEYTPYKAFEVLTKMVASLKNPSSPETKRYFTPFDAKIFIDGIQWKRRNILGCLALTIPSVGLGFKPGSRTNEAVNRFQLIVSALKPVELLTQIFRLYSGSRIDDINHFDDLVRELCIESRSPFRYTMDGEMYTALYRLRVESSNSPVQLIFV
ncbi:MAG: diacylglycerol kinase family protein [Spirochaetes bacterium]|nr:diacylglycerol kinase family protein [Spirochaetota bacterium]